MRSQQKYSEKVSKNYLNLRPVDADVGDSGLLGIVLDDDDFLGKL